jgi:hypothetical protein
MTTRRKYVCRSCGSNFEASRSHACTCGGACRTSIYRRRHDLHHGDSLRARGLV